MTMIHEEKVLCPKCGKVQWYTQIVSYNSWLTPEWFEEGVVEDLNTFRCNCCGLEIGYDTLMRYLEIQKEPWFLYFMLRRKTPVAERWKPTTPPSRKW